MVQKEIDTEEKRRFLLTKLNEEVECLSTYEFFPTMITEYHARKTYRQLAEEYHVSLILGVDGRCEDPENIAEAIVGEAIRRYDPNPEKREEVSRTRSLKNLANGRINFSKLDEEKRREISYQGVLARGRVPMAPEEKNTIERLYLEKGKKPARISQIVNWLYHGKQPVRTPKAISNYVSKSKKKKK